MAKEKACRNCNLIYDGNTCPNCGKKETSDVFKGKVEIINSEKSQIAKELKINKNGHYAIRVWSYHLGDKMDVVKNIRNELFRRNELVLKLDSEKNPGFDEAKKKLSEELKKNEDNIDVYRIKGNFGRNSFVISANVYDSKKDLDKIKKLEITRKQRKESLKKSEEESKAVDNTRKKEDNN